MAPRSSKSRGLQVVLLAILMTGVCVAQSPNPQPFRNRTDLVALDVSVIDRAGQAITGLSANDFLVLEDNVVQQVRFFSAGGRVPLAVVLLVDHSQSMVGAPLDATKQAAASFLRQLQPGDLVEVLAFNDLPLRLYPLGADHQGAEQAVETLNAGGATQLYDALYVAERDLDKGVHATGEEYQKAIVVLSDGEDTKSSQSFDDVLEDAKRHATSIDAVSMRLDERHHWMPPTPELVQLTLDTGGQTIAVHSPTDITSAYDCIRMDLRQQYRLGYISSSAAQDGRWRQISVHVQNTTYVARTRSGYFAPLAAPTTDASE